MASFGYGKQGQGPFDNGGFSGAIHPTDPLLNDSGPIVEPFTVTTAQLEWFRATYRSILRPAARFNGFFGAVCIHRNEVTEAPRAAKRARLAGEYSGENNQEVNTKPTTAPK